MTARRQHTRVALVSAAFILAAAAAAAAGAAADQGVKITASPMSRFPDIAYAVSLPSAQPLTAKRLRVTENGAKVGDVSVTKPGAEDVGVVLVIDASDSMAGKPIAGAVAAARAFEARRNQGQRLALVSFNDKVDVLLPLTSDSAAIDKALATVPKLATGTHIYDALDRAGTILKEGGIQNGSIVLLSDGKDVGSKIDQKTAIASVKDANARVFAIGLRSPQYEPAALRQVATQTSGTYSVASSAGALSHIYSELGYTLSNEYLLRYRSFAGPKEKINVAVRVKGIPGTASTAYTTPALAAGALASTPSTWDRIIRSSITLVAVILTIVAMLGYAVFRIVYRPDQALTRRIGQFVTLPADELAKQRQQEVTAVLTAREPRALGGFWERLEADLAIAQIETPLRTIALLTAVGGLVLGILVSIALGTPIGLLAIVAAPLITRFIISERLRRTRRTFSDQLPENLDVLSSGLRSGHSFIGALAVCVDDAAEPSKSEFRRVIADEQLGVPIDEALHVTGLRMKSRDIVQVALVARLQREAGTNAAAVLDQVADNVRARLELRRLIASLTAQGRMARWIVSLLPVFLFFAIWVLNKSYLRPLWHEPIGIVALVAAAVMVVSGSLVIKRIVNIEV